MTAGSSEAALSRERIVELSKRHPLSDWAAQSALTPFPEARAQSAYLFDRDSSAISTLVPSLCAPTSVRP